MGFSNKLPLLPLSDLLLRDERKKFDRLLHEEGLKEFNHSIVLGDEIQSTIMILGCIHGLFIKKTTLNPPEQSEKRRDVLFKKFDNYFNFVEEVNTGESIFYHIKNAVSHGRVNINGNSIEVINNYRNTHFKGTIPIRKFVTGYLKCSYEIELMVEYPKDVYEEAHHTIYVSSNGGPIEYISHSKMTSAMYFLSIYEHSYLTLRKIISNHFNNNLQQFDSLFSFEIKGNDVAIKSIRDYLSHNYELSDGDHILDDGNKTVVSSWEWMYCVDITAIICNVIALRIELCSR